MIDLTPLDVRNKRGDFKRIMRGYDPQEVDVFLEIAADRLEALVRENLQLRERTQTLQDQVTAQTGREQAVQDALVTAQELRADIRTQSQREAEHLIKEAEADAGRLISEAEAEVRGKLRGVERQLEHSQDTLQEMERRRARFLKEFRGLLARELDVVDVEEGRVPLEERPIDLDLGRSPGATDEHVPESPAEHGPPQEDVDGLIAGPDDSTEPVEAVSGSAVDLSSPTEDAPTLDDVLEASAIGAEPLDVSELRPSPKLAPPPDVGSQPMSLEVELMADAEGRADTQANRSAQHPSEPDHFAGVPDLETVLAEAGADEVPPPAGDGDEIAPPPIPRRREDNLILFDPDDESRRP